MAITGLTLEKASGALKRKYIGKKMAKYSPWIGEKISKIMHEGIRGKEVKRRQAIAVAINMARKKGLKTPNPLKQKAYRNMLRKRS